MEDRFSYSRLLGAVSTRQRCAFFTFLIDAHLLRHPGPHSRWVNACCRQNCFTLTTERKQSLPEHSCTFANMGHSSHCSVMSTGERTRRAPIECHLIHQSIKINKMNTGGMRMPPFTGPRDQPCCIYPLANPHTKALPLVPIPHHSLSSPDIRDGL